MNNNLIFLLKLLLITAFALLTPQPCFAFQEHGAMEGLYIHLLAHVCFGSSMLWLFFMIKGSSFWAKKWWKSIAFGSMVLALWNVMTFVGHILGPRSPYFCDLTFLARKDLSFWLWYFTKFDTLVCCLSMACFYLGLRRLNSSITSNTQEQLKKGDEPEYL